VILKISKSSQNDLKSDFVKSSIKSLNTLPTGQHVKLARKGRRQSSNTQAIPGPPIALGRLSPAKAADAFFTLIRPEFYCPDSQSHLAAQSANSFDWVSFRLPATARGRQQIRGNILTMPANWAEKNAVYKLIISINKSKLTAIILN
jgi:hypothetical protein